MSANPEDPAQAAAQERAAVEAASSAADELRGLIETSSRMIRDFLELLVTEGALAGRSLALMACLSVVLALLLATVWVLLSFALGFWLVEAGYLSLPLMLASIAIAQILMAFLLWWLIRRLARNLAFPEFVSALAGLLPRKNKEG